MMPDTFSPADLRRVMRMVGILAMLAALDAPAAPAQDDWSLWGVDFDEEKKPWKEIEAKIPTHPRAEDLMSFEVDKTSGHRFFLDAQSLSVGEDGVVRYVLVVKTAGGATNVTFEGIRCDMRQQKYYAIGQVNGGWTRARNPEWRRIGQRGQNQHDTLYEEYFCPDRRLPATPRQVIQMLKSGGGERYRGANSE